MKFWERLKRFYSRCMETLPKYNASQTKLFVMNMCLCVCVCARARIFHVLYKNKQNFYGSDDITHGE